MQIDLTQIIIAVIGVCSALITGFLIPYIQKNTSIKTQENLKLLVGIAVQAAESLYGSGQGQEKKQYVLNYLKAKGVSVDDVHLEATVYELINSFKGTDITIDTNTVTE